MSCHWIWGIVYRSLNLIQYLIKRIYDFKHVNSSY